MNTFSNPVERLKKGYLYDISCPRGSYYWPNARFVENLAKEIHFTVDDPRSAGGSRSIVIRKTLDFYDKVIPFPDYLIRFKEIEQPTSTEEILTKTEAQLLADGAVANRSDEAIVDSPNGTVESRSDEAIVDSPNGTVESRSNEAIVDSPNGTVESRSDEAIANRSDGAIVDSSNGTVESRSDGDVTDLSGGAIVDSPNGTVENRSNGAIAVETPVSDMDGYKSIYIPMKGGLLFTINRDNYGFSNNTNTVFYKSHEDKARKLLEEFEDEYNSEECNDLDYTVLLRVVGKIIRNPIALDKFCFKGQSFRRVFEDHFVYQQNKCITAESLIISMCMTLTMMKWH
jgi:hypothetical protein